MVHLTFIDIYSKRWHIFYAILCLTLFLFASSIYGQETSKRLFDQPVYSAFDPDANMLYILDKGDDSLLILDAETLDVLYKLTVGKAPRGIEYNQKTKKAYVANEENATVTMINMADVRVRRPEPKSISVGNGPKTIRIDETLNLIYTIASDDKQIYVIDGDTDSVKKVIPFPRNIHHVENDFRINKATHKVYATAGHNDAAVVFDPQTMSVKTIPLDSGGHPHLLRIDDGLNKIFVVNFRVNTVSVIDGSDDTMIAKIKVGKNPQVLTIVEANHKVYVGHQGENTIYVINGKTNKVTSKIPISGGGYITSMQRDEMLQKVVATQWLEDKAHIINAKTDTIDASLDTGETPIIPGIFEKLHRSYVLNWRSGTLTVIDLQTNKIIPPPDTIPKKKEFRGEWLSNPYDFASIDEKVFISNEAGFVTVMDTAENKMLKKIATGKLSRAIIANVRTKRIYVSNIGSGTLSFIDAATNEVIQTVTLHKGIALLAFNEHTNLLYALISSPNILYAVDTTNGNIVAKISVNETSARLKGLAILRGNLIILTDQEVIVHDGMSHKQIARIPIGYHHNARLAVDEKSNTIYVSGGIIEKEAKLTVINADNFFVKNTTPLQGDPWTLVFNPTSGTLFYTSHIDNHLHEIDPRNKSDVPVENLGREQGGVRYDPVQGILYATSAFEAVIAQNGTYHVITFPSRGSYNNFYLVGGNKKLFMSYPRENIVQIIDFKKNLISTLNEDGSITIIKDLSKKLFFLNSNMVIVIFLLFIGIIGSFFLRKKIF